MIVRRVTHGNEKVRRSCPRLGGITWYDRLFCGGGGGRDISPIYPRMEYRNSSYNLDPYNREIPIESGYVLDEAHSYDVVETEDGYDIVFHFVKGGETDGNENSK